MIGRVIPTVARVAACRGASAFAQVETVALFNPSLLETPESIAIDHDNNKYVSLALTGEIRRSPATAASPPSPCCRLGAPPLTFCGSFFAALRGLTFDEHDNRTPTSRPAIPGAAGLKIPHDGQPPTRIGALSSAVAAERHRASPRLRLCRRLGDWRDLACARHRRHRRDLGGRTELAQLPNGLPGRTG